MAGAADSDGWAPRRAVRPARRAGAAVTGGGGGRMGGAVGRLRRLGADSRRSRRSGAGGRSAGSSRFFKPYKAQVAVVLVAILLTSFIGLINPILLKLLIDIAIPERDWGLLNLFVGLMIVLPIISGVIGVGQSYLNNVIGQSVMHDLRTALYAHLQKMPLRFFTETRTGEIQSRLANDVGGIQSVVTDTAASLDLEHRDRPQHGHRDAHHRLAADGPEPRAAAVLHVPDVPGREGQPRGPRRDPEVARRDVGGDRGDPVGLGDAAVEDVRPAGAPRSVGSASSIASSPGSRSARRWSAAGSS